MWNDFYNPYHITSQTYPIYRKISPGLKFKDIITYLCIWQNPEIREEIVLRSLFEVPEIVLQPKKSTNIKYHIYFMYKKVDILLKQISKK